MKNKLAWLFPWLLCGAIVALAVIENYREAKGASGNDATGTQAPVYDLDIQTFATPNQRTALSGADTLTTAGILALPEFLTKKRQTLFVSGRFSNAAATCTIQIAYIYKSGDPNTGSSTSTTLNKIKGWSATYVLTASSSQKEGSYYEAPDALFDTEGANAIRVVVVTGPSAGTVTLVCGS